MKKLLPILLLIVSVYTVPVAFGAKAIVNKTTDTSTTTTTTTTNPSQCAGDINMFNHDYCCVTFYSLNKLKCDGYAIGVPGTAGSVTITPINISTPPATTITATPQAGSPQLAQCSAITFRSLLDILIWVKCIIVVAILPLIFAAALMFFLWGVMKFIGASDSAKKEEGKKFIIAGLIGLFVMTSLWGIINIVGYTLGTGSAVPLLQTTYLKTTP